MILCEAVCHLAITADAIGIPFTTPQPGYTELILPLISLSLSSQFTSFYMTSTIISMCKNSNLQISINDMFEKKFKSGGRNR